MSAPLLAARGLGKRVWAGRAWRTVLHEVALTVAAGEQVAIMGPSGSGKSTLLHVLAGLDAASTGTVSIVGEELAALSDAARAALRARTCGFVFQAHNLLPHLSVLDNVMLPAYVVGGARDRARAAALLTRVGLADLGRRRPGTLSGGERQRVAIARALYAGPRLIFADEPTGNLDSYSAAGIAALFATLCDEGCGLLVATHDPALAARAHATRQLRDGALA